jgi:hypothetical protein
MQGYVRLYNCSLTEKKFFACDVQEKSLVPSPLSLEARNCLELPKSCCALLNFHRCEQGPIPKSWPHQHPFWPELKNTKFLDSGGFGGQERKHLELKIFDISSGSKLSSTITAIMCSSTCKHKVILFTCCHLAEILHELLFLPLGVKICPVPQRWEMQRLKINFLQPRC